jgi:DNA-binding beta-propeller fold protein YncE
VKRSTAIVLGVAALSLLFVFFLPRRPMDGSFSYVIVDGGFRVYDNRPGFTLVKSVTFPGASQLLVPRGVAADAVTHRLYVSYQGNARSSPHLLAYDLVHDRVVWSRNYRIDSFALTPDGRKIYAPCGEGGSCDYWYVLDARTGDELGQIKMHVGAHNTIASLDGDRVYLASGDYDRLAIVDPRTDRIIDWIGPFRNSIRPFTINRDQTLAFVTVDFLSGFEVASIKTGAKLYTVEVEGFPVAPDQWPTLPATQSHGIALTPDEEELWVADDVYDHLHVFDVSGLPDARPRQIADIALRDSPKWINFTRDGHYAHISTGEIIDRRTRKVVAFVQPSRQYVQIDWAAGEPVRAYSRYGLGYRGDAGAGQDGVAAAAGR